MDLSNNAENVIKHACANGYVILSAESCTAGLIGATLTECAGASKAYHGGFIVYDDHAKHTFINVPNDILLNQGAVSPECAKAMAKGALDAYPHGNLSIAVTGIAGPDGGSAAKPVGLVYFGCCNKKDGKLYTEKKIFTGSRQDIRAQTVLHALTMLLDNMLS
tara:strand:+ start:113731 stop:114219 length:489 start_codon:yes stop_codon:yes gene_type:complete